MMQKFEYRHPRFSVNVPIRFIAQDSALPGHCTEISKQGMRIDVAQTLAANSCGKVSMHYQDRTLEFKVRVAHAGETHSGLEVLCASSAERSELAHLVAALTAPRHRPALVLVPVV
jgi:hypothetical protein